MQVGQSGIYGQSRCDDRLGITGRFNAIAIGIKEVLDDVPQRVDLRCGAT